MFNLEPEKLHPAIFHADFASLDSSWLTENFSPMWRVIGWTRIYLPLEGEGRVVHNNKEYILKKGKMYLIPPFADVHLSCPSKLEKYWTHFNLYLPGTRTDVFFLYGECMEVDTGEDFEYFCRLFTSLLKKNKGKHCRDSMESYEAENSLKLILAPFLRKILTMDVEESIPGKYKLLQYIDENIRKRMTLKELARVACLHPNYLCTRFQNEMHITLFKYIDKIRMTRSLEYFVRENLSIGEVAEKAGFPSVQAFSKHFKKYTGLSPREFLKSSYHTKISPS